MEKLTEVKPEDHPLSTKGVVSAALTTVIPRLEAILSPLLVQHPYWQLAMHEAIGLYGYYMACKQESVNEFVEFIRSHPEVFRKEIVDSEEFRSGFVLAFQDYLKLRVRNKKMVAQYILLGFTESSEKSEFPLERLDDTLLKTSLHSLRILNFIKKEILPFKEKVLREDSKKKVTERTDQSEEWWFENSWKRESLSKFVHKWLYENYSPNGEKMKQQYGDTSKWEKKFLSEVFEKEQKKSDEIYIAIDELVSLGILKVKVVDGGLGSAAGAEYEFTNFGHQFLKYIE